MNVFKRPDLLLATALLLYARAPVPALADDQLMRLEQAGLLYYGTVADVHGTKMLTTCGGQAVAVVNGSSLHASTRRCLVLHAVTGAGRGPIPAATPTPAPPGATPSPPGPRVRSVVMVEPLSVTHRDSQGQIVSPDGAMNAAVRAAAAAGFRASVFSLESVLNTGLDIAVDTTATANEIALLCPTVTDGLVILAAPHLDLFDGPAARTANLTATVQSVDCSTRQPTAAGSIATGFHPAGAGAQWSSSELTATLSQLTADLLQQFAALHQ